jgi:hypothetical protein
MAYGALKRLEQVVCHACENSTQRFSLGIFVCLLSTYELQRKNLFDQFLEKHFSTHKKTVVMFALNFKLTHN